MAPRINLVGQRFGYQSTSSPSYTSGENGVRRCGCRSTRSSATAARLRLPRPSCCATEA